MIWSCSFQFGCSILLSKKVNNTTFETVPPPLQPRLGGAEPGFDPQPGFRVGVGKQKGLGVNPNPPPQAKKGWRMHCHTCNMIQRKCRNKKNTGLCLLCIHIFFTLLLKSLRDFLRMRINAILVAFGVCVLCGAQVCKCAITPIF